MLRRASVFLTIAVTLRLAAPLSAADRYYVGPNNGSWNDPGNWSATSGGPGGAGVPVPGDVVYITDNAPRAVNFDASYATPLSQLNVEGAGALMTVTQSSAGSTMRGGDIQIGRNGMGRYEQSAGSVVIDAPLDDKFLGLGVLAGSTGTYILSGGSLSIASNRFNGGLLVGFSGQGTFNQSAGTANVAASLTVGNSSTGVGTVNQTGGSMTVSSPTVGYSLFVGRDPGAQGTYNFSDVDGPASLNIPFGNLWVGYQGNGALAQDGGNIVIQGPDGNSGNVYIAGSAGSTGHYTIQDGDLTSRVVAVGGATNAGGTGMFTVSGGTVNAALVVWTPASVVTIDGGTINSCGTPPCGPDPADNVLNNGTINIENGGTLNFGGRMFGTGITIVGGATNFQAPAGAPTLNLADQSNLQTGTVRVVAGTAASPGKLLVGKTTVDGTGNATLDIRGGATTIDGVLGIGNDGTLSFGAGSKLSPEVVRGQFLMSGGTLNAGGILLGNASGDAGEMNVSGGQIICGSMGMNDVTISNGSITVTNQTPPPGQDPMLDASIVGGYQRSGAMHVHGGTVTAPKMKLGVTSGQTGSFDMDAGTVTLGILGAGNDATLTSGQGTGTVAISAGTLNAGTVLLGSTVGGTGTMTLSGTAQVNVGGGLTMNHLIVNGGTLTVLDQAPPAGEDPVLDRSLVGGYLRDGAMTMSAGTVTTPNLKIGVTPGFAGTLTMSGGTLNAGNLQAPNGTGSVIAFNGGTLRAGQSNVDGPSAIVVGNGTTAARFDMSPSGGTHVFADGLTLSASGQLTGAGTITGNVTNSGRLAPGNSPGTLTINGNLTSTASASLMAMELGGTLATQYDRINATGTLSLGGTLHVTLIPGFTPAIGQTFTILTGSSTSGQFATKLLPRVSGVALEVQYTPTAVTILALLDSDNDTVADISDNCPFDSDITQADTDFDGTGDVCDLNDGINFFKSFQGTGIDWQAESAQAYNLYRASLSNLRATGIYTPPGAALACGFVGTHFVDTAIPPPGQANFYLVTSRNGGVESSLGNRGNNTPRPNANPCP